MQTYVTVRVAEAAEPIDVAGAKVQLVDHDGSATISVEAPEKHRLRIDVDPGSARESLTIEIDLAISGRNAWPVADVEVLNPKGQPIPVRHPGIEWHRLQIEIPPTPGEYVVHVVDPPGGNLPALPEEGRHVTDAKTGLSASVAKWFHARRAALSIRFDDSHSTHLTKAIPILGEYGFRGTFMVNPGAPDGHSPNPRWRSAFEDHRSQWQTVAQSGDHEFANHTLHHRGAQNDTEMEHQVGDASKAIWELSPGKSRLLALNLGGGTSWETTRTLRYYLNKYYLFDASSGSLGMDDVYGNRVAAFRQHVERNIETGGLGWCQIHFHYIGAGLSSSEENFRSVLDIAKERESDLWIAGMADIYKYHFQRDRTQLAIESQGPKRVALTLSCTTDPKLYDQPLTIQVALPPDWPPEDLSVQLLQTGAAAPTAIISEGATIRFDIPPINATYVIERTR
jgi:hypothetical protein